MLSRYYLFFQWIGGLLGRWCPIAATAIVAGIARISLGEDEYANLEYGPMEDGHMEDGHIEDGERTLTLSAEELDELEVLEETEVPTENISGLRKKVEDLN